MARKYGPTKGEFQFRLCAGFLIICLLGLALYLKGSPGSLIAVETFLFGGVFAMFLVGHSAWRLIKQDYRQG